MYWALHFLQVTQYITFDVLHVIFCLMLKVCCVVVMAMLVPNVPFSQVLHLLSPHLWNPSPMSTLLSAFWCINLWWISLPFDVLKDRPHSSQTHEFRSIGCVLDADIFVSGGSRRDTSRSPRFLFLLYAIRGGFSKMFLHLSLACNIGCSSCNFWCRFGSRGLYVVEKMILFSIRLGCSWLCRRSSRDSAAALRRPSLMSPTL